MLMQGCSLNGIFPFPNDGTYKLGTYILIDWIPPNIFCRMELGGFALEPIEEEDFLLY
jgi:hypothetical protein